VNFNVAVAIISFFYHTIYIWNNLRHQVEIMKQIKTTTIHIYSKMRQIRHFSKFKKTLAAIFEKDAHALGTVIDISTKFHM